MTEIISETPECFAEKMIPVSTAQGVEEWNQYARLLLVECSKKLLLKGDASISSLCHLATRENVETLRSILADTPANVLFIDGAERGLESIRHIIYEHMKTRLVAAIHCCSN